jgi:hypothetical protein
MARNDLEVGGQYKKCIGNMLSMLGICLMFFDLVTLHFGVFGQELIFYQPLECMDSV